MCPVANEVQKSEESTLCFAGIHKDEQIRQESSSGGAFRALAEAKLRNQGIGYAVRMNEEQLPIHAATELGGEALLPFMGSKYVQSDFGDLFPEIRRQLQQGKYVFFTGTPCQVKGLRLFLRKSYLTLTAAEIVCHGVPSPLIWKRYLTEQVRLTALPTAKISFRDKSKGWEEYRLRINQTVYPKNDLFMKGYFANLYLRPSCYDCPARTFTSGADITSGDCW